MGSISGASQLVSAALNPRSLRSHPLDSAVKFHHEGCEFCFCKIRAKSLVGFAEFEASRDGAVKAAAAIGADQFGSRSHGGKHEDHPGGAYLGAHQA